MMQKIKQMALATLLVWVMSAPVFAADLSVVVHNIKTHEGKVLLQVWHKDYQNLWDEGNLDEGKPAKRMAVPADGDEVVFNILDIPNGTYAIRLHHDVNGNNKMDTNFIGIPKEPFGFSNDAMGTMGPPSFEAASIAINGDVTIRLKMFD